MRGRIVELIPKSVLYSTAVGIGCFLAFIGLQKSEGIGAIVYDGATLVTIGGCPPAEQVGFVGSARGRSTRVGIGVRSSSKPMRWRA